VVKFHFANSKLREKHFSSETLIRKYQISKSREVLAPPAPLFRRPYERVTDTRTKQLDPSAELQFASNVFAPGSQFIEIARSAARGI